MQDGSLVDQRSGTGGGHAGDKEELLLAGATPAAKRSHARSVPCRLGEDAEELHPAKGHGGRGHERR